MPDAPSPRIFLSYSRVDCDFAAQLRDDLIAAGHPVWHDLKDMVAGQWWDQIAAQLRAGSSVEHIVLVVSPEAIASHIVEREWRLAKREGKRLSAVMSPQHQGRIDFAALPRWISAEHHYNLAEPDQRARLFQALKQPGRQPRRPDPLKRVPDAEGYVLRTAKLAEIKAALLDKKREAKASTVVLSGAGGFGKSTLAIAIMNDPEVQDACYDGILWVELREELVKIASGPRGRELLRDALKAKIESLIRDLTGEGEVYADLDRARDRLRELLTHKHVLLVIDDAWADDHARHIIEAAPEAAKLVTTRRIDVLSDANAHVSIDQLTECEALDLISLRLPDPAPQDRAKLQALAQNRVGGWPLLIRLINGQLRLATTARPGRSAQTLTSAIADLEAKLHRDGLDALDPTNATERDRAVRLSVGVSFEMLAEADRWSRYPQGFHEARYRDLAGFQAAEVPIGTIARLWAHLCVLKAKAAPLDAADAVRHSAQERAWREAVVAESAAILERLYALALLLAIDASEADGMVCLHDVMRTYLGDVQGEEARAAFHQQFVLAYDAEAAQCATNMGDRERRYFYTWYPTHLAAAGERETLDAVLLDPGWLRAKMSELKEPLALVADYTSFGSGRLQKRIERTLRLTSGICLRNPQQLLAQLISRLTDVSSPQEAKFLVRARQIVGRPTLLVLGDSLTTSIAETRRLEGHTLPVTCLADLPGHRLASASGDAVICLWDTNAGAVIARLEGHSSAVSAMVALQDGRLASAAEDGTIRVWDFAGGRELSCQSSTSPIGALAVLSSMRLASGSADGTIQIWKTQGVHEFSSFTGPEQPVTALAALPSDGLACGYADGSLAFWDESRGFDFPQAPCHSRPVRAMAVSPEGWLASGAEDGSIIVWDIATRAKFRRFAAQKVAALAWLPDGLLASAGERAIRLWHVEDGVERNRIEGHSRRVRSLALLSSNQLASGAEDTTIRVWSLAEAGRLDGHAGWVRSVLRLPDGRLATGCWDRTIRFWSPETRVEMGRIEGHSDCVNALTLLRNGQLASGSWDGTIGLWDVASKAPLGRLDGHGGRVEALTALPDGRLASASGDAAIRIWHPESGNEIARLQGHSRPVMALITLADGRLASGSEDGTVRIWDLEQAAEIERLEGHDDAVYALSQLSDGRLASASGDTTICVWDLSSARTVARMTGHSRKVKALAALPCGGLVSGSDDCTVRLWQPLGDGSAEGRESCRLEVDGGIRSLYAYSNSLLVAGDQLGRLHWMEIVR